MQPLRHDHQVGERHGSRSCEAAVGNRQSGCSDCRLPIAGCLVLSVPSLFAMGIENENDQADRAISTGKLHALLRFHTRPIDVVVYHGSDREYSFRGGFPA